MDNEELKKRLDNAEKEKDEAKKRYDDAEAKLQIWQSELGNSWRNNTEYISYQNYVRELGDIYNNLLQIYNTLLQKISNPAIPMHVKEDKEYSATLSQAGSNFYAKLIEEYSIGQKTIISPISQDLSATTNSFEWEKSVENSAENRTNYLRYIKDEILVGIEDFPINVFDGSGETNLLDAYLGERKLRGTCDVMISSCIETFDKLINCHVIFEVKKLIVDKNVRQAKLELLCADYHSNYTVIVVLTDLMDKWKFFWLEKPDTADNKTKTAYICGATVTRNLAIGYLRYHLKWVAKRRRKEEARIGLDFSDPFDDEDECKDDDVEEQTKKKRKLTTERRPTFLGTKYSLCHLSKYGNNNDLSDEQIRSIALTNFIRKYEDDFQDWIVPEEKEVAVDKADSNSKVLEWVSSISEKDGVLAKQESSSTVV
ncbi:hypothetical protein HK103_005033 [Boothiomyces macroporosus]|uniref:Uncharacterized protein n=1 Tax=Boothiomyces macroporosus TaxID=261099 RepID=A0AAD5UG81_9FUNG|nr:hypothetical protein HK103_005033 [Boothiomyces macroporosus]